MMVNWKKKKESTLHSKTGRKAAEIVDSHQESIRLHESILDECYYCSYPYNLIRFHLPKDSIKWNNAVEYAFPEFKTRVHCVASTWIGKQISLDRANQNERMLILDIGIGEAFEIECAPKIFFKEKSVVRNDLLFDTDLYLAWRKTCSDTIPEGQCCGFKVPLYLGGKYSVDNMEITDLEVYWHLFGQLFQKTRNLADGTRVAVKGPEV